MADRNFFKTTDGNKALPVTSDGVFFTDLIDFEQGSLCEVYVEFYSDEELKVPVTPSAGTVSASASPLGNVFLESSGSTNIHASKVSVPDGTYDPIILDGLIKRAKVSVTGITGASYMKAIIFNHD